MDSFAQGSSIPRTVTLTDGTNNLDTSNFLTIEVKVKHRKWRTSLGTYTLAAGEVTKESPTSGGQITFIIPAATSEDGAVGVYEYDVTTTETDADYENSTRTRKLVPAECFYLKRAL